MQEVLVKPVLCRIIIGILWSASALLAQGATAQIVGRVSDPSGSAVPGAAIKVTNVDTGSVREAQSDEGGAYALPLLQPGNYRMAITKTGFRPVSRTGIVLQVDQVTRIDHELELGSVSQEVVVTEPSSSS